MFKKKLGLDELISQPIIHKTSEEKQVENPLSWSSCS